MKRLILIILLLPCLVFAETFTHSYSKPGNYKATVTATDVKGKTAKASVLINVYDEDVIARAVNSGFYIAGVESETLNINIWPGQRLEFVSLVNNVITYKLSDNPIIVRTSNCPINAKEIVADDMGLIDWTFLTVTDLPYFDGTLYKLSFNFGRMGEYYTVDLTKVIIK